MSDERGGGPTASASSASRRAVAWIDGGSRGNPGEAGCGIVIELVGGAREAHTLFLGRTTNNVAEYAALLACLERGHQLSVSHIDVYCDSQLVVEQINGRYRIRARHLQPIWVRAQQLLRGYSRCRVVHVSRDSNREADRLANLAIESRTSTLPRPEGLP